MSAPEVPVIPDRARMRVPYEQLLSFARETFVQHGLALERAHTAAAALCYGDLNGLDSHGLFNLARLYLPLLSDGRADPRAEPELLNDLGACALVDSRRALGLWAASDAMDSAIDRARQHGIGFVSVRNATHFGCAGAHAVRAAQEGMIGLVASNCGSQRIARPPGGLRTMLGTNPLSVAAPAVDEHPFVLDMSTTTVPTGKVRTAARNGETIPEGWLQGEDGSPVTEPASFDRGEAHLRWLGGDPNTGAYKGFGLGLMVELLSAVLPGAALGPAPEALDGNGGPNGHDDNIGFAALAVAPGMLFPEGDFAEATRSLFCTLLSCPPADQQQPVRYPGWVEAERAAEALREGVPIAAHLHEELVALGLNAAEGAH